MDHIKVMGLGLKLSLSKLKNKFIFSLMSLFPIKRNKVIFSNFLGRGYGCNCKYICNKLLEKKDEFDIVWLVSSDNICLPEGVRPVKIFSFRYYYELATSSIWVDNCRKSLGTVKRKGQYYIQTWHGDLPLKKIEADAIVKLTPEYVSQAKRDSKMADLFVSGSKFTSNLYRNAFWYDGEIAEIGMPRMEILLEQNKTKKKEIKEKLGIDENINIVFYVPTFRNKSSKDNIDVYRLDWNHILIAVEQKFHGNWLGMLRLHPNIANLAQYLNLPPNIIDVTNYPDMQELLLVSDLCITDYSSCMFEFAMTYKGVFLYVPDFDEYKKERDVYFSLADTPFDIAYNTMELESNILRFDTTLYKSKLKEFFEEHGVIINKDSASILADRIYKLCYKNDKKIV